MEPLLPPTVMHPRVAAGHDADAHRGRDEDTVDQVGELEQLGAAPRAPPPTLTTARGAASSTSRGDRRSPAVDAAAPSRGGAPTGSSSRLKPRMTGGWVFSGSSR